MKAFTTTENKDISLIIDEFNLIRKQPNYKKNS